jgi:glycosyltransferase involved in cell wall biosynthesis
LKKYFIKIRNVVFAQSKRFINKFPLLKKAIIKLIKTFETITGLKLIKDNYELWLKNNTPTLEQLQEQVIHVKKFSYRPLISIVTPVFNTDPLLLGDCIESVLAQSYYNWELILVDDKSTNTEPKEIIQKYADTDDRVKAIFNKKNLHISGATNEGIKVAKGEYIALLDHDDILYPHALFSIVDSLQNNRHDFIYSDEDKLSEDGRVRSNPFFKPDWSPDFLRSINYITHFAVIKKSLINKVGGFRSEFNGAQDWDLFMRTTREAKSIYHIQDVLYGWRMSNNSTAQNTEAKPYVVDAQRKALKDDAKARGLVATIEQSKYIKDYWSVNYKVKGSPLVSIIIPTKNQYHIVKRCIDSILDKSTYNHYEIILVDTGSTENDVINWYKKIKNKKIKQLSFVEDKFSYANSCNYGASKASGEYLIMLNNDTEVITPNWIELMLGDAQRKEVGSVGVLLYYPGNKHIQHAGIGIGLGGYAANLLGAVVLNNMDALQKIYGLNKRNVAANTAACIMIKSGLFKNLKGFDNKFSVTYNDVDLGLRLLKNGYVNVYNPAVELTHHESISLGLPEESKRDSIEFDKAKYLLKKRWQIYITNDPYLNMHYSKGHANFTIAD